MHADALLYQGNWCGYCRFNRVREKVVELRRSVFVSLQQRIEPLEQEHERFLRL